jgi:NAD(P)-dependent dehydrogenase (short-subunit alcohol dehydrogenase family)
VLERRKWGPVSKVWFITGTSRGFGRDWAIAALERGDQVAATARTVASLDDLTERFGDLVLPLALDVNSRENAFDAVSAAEEHFGGLDVVVNNAGYGQFGFAEELSEADWRNQIETNLFGAVWVTQAALPVLRRSGGGRILQVSSIGGISAFAGLSAYHASKWALEGFSQALAQEVNDFNIKITLIEPGGYSTDWGGASAKWADPLSDYDDLRQQMIEWRARRNQVPGDPSATGAVVLKLVDAEDPPLRIFFGDGPLALATTDYEGRLATWREWAALSHEAQGPVAS